MPSRVVVGLQWGDEGKGRVIDSLAGEADIVVRYQGGANAGHTVWVDSKRYVFHLIPSGILHPETTCIMGGGMVVDLQALLDEIDGLNIRGINTQGHLFLSPRAHLVLPQHKGSEGLWEKRIGTTLKGIGPAYAQKYARLGVRVGDLYQEGLEEKLRLSSAEEDIQGLAQRLQELGKRIGPYIRDVEPFLNRALQEGKSLLFEGAQGTLLDIDQGTYPFVTSSHTTAGGACVGTGVGPTKIDEVIGVTKSYATRVGNGPFPTELGDELGELLQRDGEEYGATTGRPRRCGWLDLVALRYACQVNGVQRVALTKLDVLDRVPRIKLCVAYLYKGEKIEDFPLSLDHCEPVYEEFPGWENPTKGIRDFGKLPQKASDYIKRIVDYIGVKICWAFTGPKREDRVEIG